jgi:death-on-curing protein
MTFYLNLEILIGELGPTGFFVKDPGLLDSALARPKTSLFGEDAYPSLELKAAAMMHSIIKNHPMVDGNKRTSWIALNSFLALNGYSLIATTEESLKFVLAVATDKINLQEMEVWIAEHKTVR